MTLEPSDEDLMVAYASGDRAAFRTLFDRYAPIFLRTMLRSLSSREEANDLVQQTFLQIHRARLDFERDRSFRSWAFTIALNLKREYFRRVRRKPTLHLDDSAEVATPAFDQRFEARRSVSWALARLPEDQREIIELHWLEGLSFQEVAGCVGISEGAAKVRAHRAYTRLRALLDDGRPPERNPFDSAGIRERERELR